MSMHATVRHHPHPDEAAPVPYLRYGQLISLIHWGRVAGDWKYTTILVEYAGRDETAWHVLSHGEPVTLDRADWSIFN